MTQPRRLDDVLGTFEKRKPETTEAVEAPVLAAQEVEEAVHPALVAWMAALSRLSDLLDEESEAAVAGDASRAAEFTRRKAESEHEIRRHARRAEQAGARVPASHNAEALAVLTRLEASSSRNAACLGALREATSWIVSAIKRSAAAASDEGMYSRKGKGVGPGDHSLSRLDAKL